MFGRNRGFDSVRFIEIIAIFSYIQLNPSPGWCYKWHMHAELRDNKNTHMLSTNACLVYVIYTELIFLRKFPQRDLTPMKQSSDVKQSRSFYYYISRETQIAAVEISAFFFLKYDLQALFCMLFSLRFFFFSERWLLKFSFAPLSSETALFGAF